jgi:hypothetical protein
MQPGIVEIVMRRIVQIDLDTDRKEKEKDWGYI